MMSKIFRAILTTSVVFFYASAWAQNAGDVPLNYVPLGKGPGVVGFGSFKPSTLSNKASPAGTDKLWIEDGSGNYWYSTISQAIAATASGVTGPGTTVVGHVALWGNVGGTSLTDFAATLHGPSPTNLYVATTGNDSNSCLVIGTPCLTIQKAVQLAYATDFGGADITINLAAGTYTTGVKIAGSLIGVVRTNTTPASLKIVGAGSGTTTINASSTCGTTAHPIYVGRNTLVGLGSVKLITTCTGGSDFYIDGGIGYLVDNDVNFGTADQALIAAVNFGRFDANFVGSGKLVTFSGSATYGFLLSTYGAAITGISVANVISGTPAYSSAFVQAIDGSFFNMGTSSSWTNAAGATGPRYSLALNSFIDTEQITSNLPGNAKGALQAGSYYYDNRNTPTVSSSTGLGAGGTTTLYAGSNDHSGSILLTAGTGASASGDITIALGSQLKGDWGGGGHCVVSLNQISTPWVNNASVQGYYDSGAGVSNLVVHWNNNATAFTNATAHYISYICS